MKCDKRQGFQCGLCGRATFVIFVQMKFVYDEMYGLKMKAENLGETRNNGGNDSDSTFETPGQRNTRKYWTAIARGRSRSHLSARKSTCLYRKRSCSMECTKGCQQQQQHVHRFEDKTTKKVKGTVASPRIDTKKICVEESERLLKKQGNQNLNSFTIEEQRLLIASALMQSSRAAPRKKKNNETYACDSNSNEVEVKPRKKAEVHDRHNSPSPVLPSCCKYNPNMAFEKDVYEKINSACCCTKMRELKKHIHKPQVTNLDAYAIEGMRLQMGAPYKIKKSVDPFDKEFATKDIRFYTKEERSARLEYVNEKYKFDDPQEKYLVFGCQFVTNRRHMEWLSSEPKEKYVCSGIPLVRRVLYCCSNSMERHCELIELPYDFEESRFSRNALSFPFICLKKSQLLAKCPDQNCQESLFMYNISFHLTIKHNNWLVKHLELNTPYTFQLDLNVTNESVKCHAVIQLQNVLLEYSKYGSNLSLTIMSRHVQLSEILGNCQTDQRLTLVWAATSLAKTFPIMVSLTLWSTGGDVPKSTISYTGKPFDIKKSIRPYHLIKSGRVLMLTANQVNALTQKGKEKVGITFIARMANI